jgi:DNA repair protein REV1
LIPSSLSQVDTTVLQQLPEELKADILENLPAHRIQDFSSNVLLGLTEIPLEALGTKKTENHSGSKDVVLDKNLWAGIPPQWVDTFKVSNCLILNILAEMYYKSGSTGNLSSILQRISSASKHQLDASQDGWDEATYILCELLKQYIKLKIELDIEEIYVCFRLLRRFALGLAKSLSVMHSFSFSMDITVNLHVIGNNADTGFVLFYFDSYNVFG